jgi:23S rRNA pseudouridine1911/1915/1917 synthase
LLNFIVEENINERLDKYLSGISKISRIEIQKLIAANQILVNNKIINLNKYKVKDGDKIEILSRINREITVISENIPLDIVYEDDLLLVVNKANMMVTHPAPGNYTGTLVNALLYHFNHLSDINGDLRPGIVHRLDKETSGLLVVAKDNDTHNFLAEQLKNHDIQREYLAIVEGIVPNKLTHIDLPIGRSQKNRQMMAVQYSRSKKAMTHVHVEKKFPKNTLVRCILETGRTHQIRVHLTYIKHPVLGDNKYGKKLDSFGQYLHAEKLVFTHPNGKKMTFYAKLPKEFSDKVDELSNQINI